MGGISLKFKKYSSILTKEQEERISFSMKGLVSSLCLKNIPLLFSPKKKKKTFSSSFFLKEEGGLPEINKVFLYSSFTHAKKEE